MSKNFVKERVFKLIQRRIKMKRFTILMFLTVSLLITSCSQQSATSGVLFPDTDATLVAQQVANQLTAEALSVAQAQLELDQLRATDEASQGQPQFEESAAPEPTSEPQPTAPAAVRDRIVLFGFNEFTKLESLAFANGISLTPTRSISDFINWLTEPDVAAAIYVIEGRQVQQLDLIELEGFSKTGGRVLFFYDDRWAEHNSTLQDLFLVSVAAEEIREIYEATLLYDDTMLPGYMRGLRILGTRPKTQRIYIKAYLTTTLQGGERTYFTSQETGRDRLLYLSTADGKVTFWPSVRCTRSEGAFDSFYSICPFIGDESIGFADNDRATLAVLNYLLGR